MNFKRKLLIFLISIIFMMPIPSIAYTKVIPGGESIGITIDIPGVLVVGFYKVNNQDIARNSGLKIGDRIVGINDNKITDIEDLSKEITSEEKEITLKLDIIRENNPLNINLTLTKEKNGIYKTGMYVKDSITGIGTLTFITKDYKYGALGHAVIESNSENIVDIKRGKIFASAITSITKSNNKETGEKNAHIFFKNSLGSI